MSRLENATGAIGTEQLNRKTTFIENTGHIENLLEYFLEENGLPRR
jgi:hypothetical protein